MARGVITCDSCGQQIAKPAIKLWLSNDTGGKNDHSSYTAHADIGQCCVSKFIGNGGTIKWQRRKSNKRTKVTK